jgi:hypothetical protein
MYRACKALLQKFLPGVGALRERDGFSTKKIADAIRSYRNAGSLQ